MDGLPAIGERSRFAATLTLTLSPAGRGGDAIDDVYILPLSPAGRGQGEGAFLTTRMLLPDQANRPPVP